ncbi:MAG: hypothetical protein ACXWZY_10835 [Gaiellaceae bacterium]
MRAGVKQRERQRLTSDGDGRVSAWRRRCTLSRDDRALLPYLAVSCTLSAAGGGIYDAGLIGVPALYGLLILASVISLVGYARWDERHYG